MARSLYLVAYDIRDNSTRQRVYRYLSGFRVAGQKSVPEIWVTPAELHSIYAALREMVDVRSDRVQLLALDPRMPVRCLGVAGSFKPGFFAIV